MYKYIECQYNIPNSGLLSIIFHFPRKEREYNDVCGSFCNPRPYEFFHSPSNCMILEIVSQAALDVTFSSY